MRTLISLLRMHTPNVNVDGSRVSLRVERFKRYADKRGLRSTNARAQHVGVHHKTMGRIEEGDFPSERVIAQILQAFPEAKGFHDLFEITNEGNVESLRPAS